CVATPPRRGRKSKELPRRKTHEEFIEEIQKLVGGEYTALDQYSNSQTKIEMIHNRCGYKWKIIPNNFLKGRRCPKCIKKEMGEKFKKTTSQFKKEIFDLVG